MRENHMAQYTYFLFDTGVRMVHTETIKHVDSLDALERMRMMLDDFADIETVQLWQHENYIGHITRSEGRLILKRQSDPMPAHPLLGPIAPETQAAREIKAS